MDIDSNTDKTEEQSEKRTGGIERYRIDESRPTVSYGPRPHASDDWVLSLSCENERVEVTLDEESMYELWIEVRGVPWPDPSLPGAESRREQNRLVRQVVHAANGADTEMLEAALKELGMRE